MPGKLYISKEAFQRIKELHFTADNRITFFETHVEMEPDLTESSQRLPSLNFPLLCLAAL